MQATQSAETPVPESVEAWRVDRTHLNVRCCPDGVSTSSVCTAPTPGFFSSPTRRAAASSQFWSARAAKERATPRAITLVRQGEHVRPLCTTVQAARPNAGAAGAQTLACNDSICPGGMHAGIARGADADAYRETRAAPETSDSELAEATRPEKSSYSYLHAGVGEQSPQQTCCAASQELCLLVQVRPARSRIPGCRQASTGGAAGPPPHLLYESATVLTPSCGCTTASGLELRGKTGQRDHPIGWQAGQQATRAGGQGLGRPVLFTGSTCPRTATAQRRATAAC